MNELGTIWKYYFVKIKSIVNYSEIISYFIIFLEFKSLKIKKEKRYSIQKDTITTINLSIVTFLVMLGLSIIAPILPEYASEFHVNYTLVGLVVAAFGISRMLMDLPTSMLAQQYNKKMILLVGLILVSSSSILAGFAPNYATLFVARLIEGMGSAIYVTTATVYLAQIAEPGHRGALMSIYSGFMLLGSIFGPSFGGFVASAYGIRAPFYAYAIVSAIGVIPTLFLPKVTNINKEKLLKVSTFFRGALSTLKDRNFIPVLPAVFALFFIRTGVRSTLVPLYGTNNLGLNEIAIGILLTIAGLTTAATMVPVGKISDKTGRRTPLLLSLLLSAPVVFWIPFISNFTILCINMTLYGAAVGLSGPIAAFVTDVSKRDKLETYMGMYRMIGDVGFIVGPLLMGFIADYTGTIKIIGGTNVTLLNWEPFVVAGLIMFLAAFILLKSPNLKHTLIKK